VNTVVRREVHLLGGLSDFVPEPTLRPVVPSEFNENIEG
jgi:hypothetical protein